MGGPTTRSGRCAGRQRASGWLAWRSGGSCNASDRCFLLALDSPPGLDMLPAALDAAATQPCLWAGLSSSNPTTGLLLLTSIGPVCFGSTVCWLSPSRRPSPGTPAAGAIVGSDMVWEALVASRTGERMEGGARWLPPNLTPPFSASFAAVAH